MKILHSSYAQRCGGGGGGILKFSFYVDLDLASTVYPKKHQKYQAYPQL